MMVGWVECSKPTCAVLVKWWVFRTLPFYVENHAQTQPRHPDASTAQAAVHWRSSFWQQSSAGRTTLVVPRENFHDVMRFLRDDAECQYDFLSDVVGVDYLNYPHPKGAPAGRFGVVYNLESTVHNRRLFVKVLLDPSIDTTGTEPDPALPRGERDRNLLASALGEWTDAGEVYDMFGIRLRRPPRPPPHPSCGRHYPAPPPPQGLPPPRPRRARGLPCHRTRQRVRAFSIFE